MRELYEADSTDPGSMEAGAYGLTRGTYFVARGLEVVAVAGLLWISWCVLGGKGFFRAFSPNFFVSFERIRPAASTRPPCLIYLPNGNGLACRLNKSLCSPVNQEKMRQGNQAEIAEENSSKHAKMKEKIYPRNITDEGAAVRM